MNTEKRLKLCVHYNVQQQIIWITLGDFQMVGDSPSQFMWGEGDENSHSKQYTNYIRDTFLGSDYLTGYQVVNVHANTEFWNMGVTRGTTDVVVYQLITLCILGCDQAIGKLIATNEISSKRPVIALSKDQYLSHTSPIIYGINFNNIHQASTFARTLLVSSEVLSEQSEQIQTRRNGTRGACFILDQEKAEEITTVCTSDASRMVLYHSLAGVMFFKRLVIQILIPNVESHVIFLVILRRLRNVNI
ncbi:hypothetical protein G9A89_001274 [Geosiphon pyriformis]|nr:hypothetical protein G9A89_001274 [Geosiphon pyriformis]